MFFADTHRHPRNNTPAKTLPFALVFTLVCALLAACSDGSDNFRRSLGVPGSGDANIVAVPAAALEGPLPGSPVLVSTFFSLPGVGYEQAEYFVSGNANAYVNRNELQSNGRWQVQADEQAAYRTRIVVNRPSDPADFNGTVLVEWLNVSAGFDSAPDWGMLHTELIRSGYAWVGVSAQKVGVDSLIDGTAAATIPGTPIDDRYASLVHPGDAFSYDIYAQITQALREPAMVSLWAATHLRQCLRPVARPL